MIVDGLKTLAVREVKRLRGTVLSLQSKLITAIHALVPYGLPLYTSVSLLESLLAQKAHTDSLSATVTTLQATAQALRDEAGRKSVLVNELRQARASEVSELEKLRQVVSDKDESLKRYEYRLTD